MLEHGGSHHRQEHDRRQSQGDDGGGNEGLGVLGVGRDKLVGAWRKKERKGMQRTGKATKRSSLAPRKRSHWKSTGRTSKRELQWWHVDKNTAHRRCGEKKEKGGAGVREFFLSANGWQ